MENVPGESTTDKHHRGVWLGFKSVNGFNFWENEFSYNDKNAGKVAMRRIEEVKSGENAGSFRGIFAWLSPAGEAMLEEDRTMTFYADPEVRTFDVDLTYTAKAPLKFADTKEGFFAIRLDENSLLYAGVCVLLGLQCIVFSVLTKTFGAGAGLLPVDPRFERFLSAATLERGLLLGATVFALGCLGTAIAFFRWGGTSFGNLDESAIARLTVPSVTALAAGVEIAFASFFISILRIGRVGAQPYVRNESTTPWD